MHSGNPVENTGRTVAALVDYPGESVPVFLLVEIHGGDVSPARKASPAHGAHGRVEFVLATEPRLIVEGPLDADAWPGC